MTPGTAIRARVAPERRWLRGSFAAYGPDGLRLRPCATCQPVAVPLDRVTALEVRVGRAPRRAATLGGALLGAGVGAAALAAVALLDDRRCHDGPCGLGVSLLPPVGALAGAGVGAAVGARLRFDRWRPAVVRPAPR